MYRVVEDRDLYLIWEDVARSKRRVEGLATLNHVLLRGIPSYQRVFLGRTHFSTSLPILAFVKNFLLINPSLYLE